MRLSQRAFALRVGVDKSTIISWEKDRTSPSGGDLTALLSVVEDYLDHSPPDVFPPPRLVRESGASDAAGQSAPWAAGVRHATSAIMRTLADLLQEAEAVDDADAAPPFDRRR